jgi:hypothetical protein
MFEHSIAWWNEPAVSHWDCCGFSSWLWLIDKALPYAPLITVSIATIAGVVAIISITVTKKIARRRAAIDFFLKTEMDQSMLTLFDNCQKHMRTVNSFIKADTTIEQLMEREGYGPVRTYLNIHELIAVGIENRVFDQKVCYQFWSALLVLHSKQAAPLVEFCRRNPEEAAVYLQFTNLAKKWERKIEWWRWRQSWLPHSLTYPNPLPHLLPAPPVSDNPAPQALDASALAEASLQAGAKEQTFTRPQGPNVEATGQNPAQPVSRTNDELPPAAPGAAAP